MAINRNSAENGSDTPDFILAEYLMTCLDNFDKTVHARSDWYSHHCRIGSCNHSPTKCVEPPVESKTKIEADIPEIITKTCLICDGTMDCNDKYWCKACLEKQIRKPMLIEKDESIKEKTNVKEPICDSCVKRSTCYFAQGGYICEGYQKEDPTKCPTCLIGHEYGCKESDPCPSNGYNNWRPLNSPKPKVVNTKIKQPTIKEPESIGKAISEAILDEETHKLGRSIRCSTCCEYFRRKDVECDSNFNWRNCKGPYAR